MGLREKMIGHIKELTGNPNADLWTLKFNSEDGYLSKSQIHGSHINEIPIRTQEDISKEAKEVQRFFYRLLPRKHNHYFGDCHFSK